MDIEELKRNELTENEIEQVSGGIDAGRVSALSGIASRGGASTLDPTIGITSGVASTMLDCSTKIEGALNKD